jgi:molybdopterin synthase catalytic subunit
VVVFAGTVRDHSEGRPSVTALEYEAYVRGAERAMWAVVADLRRRWPVLGRVALLHRTGVLAPTDVAVVTAVSAPHRREAFEAAEHAIDAVKADVPIWKHETWAGGAAWGLGAQPAPVGQPGLDRPAQLRRVGA